MSVSPEGHAVIRTAGSSPASPVVQAWRALRNRSRPRPASTADRLHRTASSSDDAQLARLYLDLLKGSLTRSMFQTWQEADADPEAKASMAARGLKIVQAVPADPALRAEGRDWPLDAETMIGMKRLDNIEKCVRDVVANGVPGDLIETGVWRGGATIFMRGVLEAVGDTERRVWVADSFQGLPRVDRGEAPPEPGDDLWSYDFLAVPLEEVQANFARYGLLDDRVRFLRGWFQDTLPRAPIGKLAVARLDGDLYDSTMVALTHLYPKLSLGGYLIVDDYGAYPQCRQAVDDFRATHAIHEPLREIDWTGVYWQKDPPEPAWRPWLRRRTTSGRH